jgi:excinuclease ABC subunit C
VTFHRTRRNADRLRGELARIPGIGEKTAAKLLRHFGSLDRVREASEEDLAAVVGKAAARKLRSALGPAVPAADAAAQLTILE